MPKTVLFFKTSAINKEYLHRSPEQKPEKYLTCGKRRRKKMIQKREKLLQEVYIVFEWLLVQNFYCHVPNKADC